MSNAAVVTRAVSGGGHSTALLLTTGGLLSRSDLFGHVVINLFDLFLLSCLECFSFTWRRRSMQGRPLFPGLWPRCVREPSEHADPLRGSARPAPDGGDQQAGMEKSCSSTQRSNKQVPVHGLPVQQWPFFFPNLFAWKGFYEAQQPWRMSLNHGASTQRPLLTDVHTIQSC